MSAGNLGVVLLLDEIACLFENFAAGGIDLGEVETLAKGSIFLAHTVNRFDGGVITNFGAMETDVDVIRIVGRLEQVFELLNGTKEEGPPQIVIALAVTLFE